MILSAGIFKISQNCGMASQVELICSDVLCRKTQVQRLLSFFGHKEDFSCPCTFVYGHSGTGKSLVVQKILDVMEVSL